MWPAFNTISSFLVGRSLTDFWSDLQHRSHCHPCHAKCWEHWSSNLTGFELYVFFQSIFSTSDLPSLASFSWVLGRRQFSEGTHDFIASEPLNWSVSASHSARFNSEGIFLSLQCGWIPWPGLRIFSVFWLANTGKHWQTFMSPVIRKLLGTRFGSENANVDLGRLEEFYFAIGQCR